MQSALLNATEVVDLAVLFLKSRYEEELETCQARLENFERVNWPRMKETLREELLAVQLAHRGSHQEAIRHVVNQLEILITD